MTTDCLFYEVSESADGFQIIIACLKPSKVKNYVRSLFNESLCVSIEAVRYAMACFPSGGRCKRLKYIRFKTAWLFTVRRVRQNKV